MSQTFSHHGKNADSQNTLIVLLLTTCLFGACESKRTVTPNEARPLGSSDIQSAPSTLPAATPTPETEVKLENNLSIVPKQITLESQKLRYTIDITYPQIEGSKDARILRLNHQIKRHVSQPYHWMLNPSAKDLRYYRKMHPEAFNSVDSTYQVIVATDEFVSIYIDTYSYGIGAAHSVQQSFTVNYDLRSGRLLSLRDIFKEDFNYLQYVSRYCIDDLQKRFGDSLFKEELTPKEKNYQSWNITKEGIKINFDACKVLGCLGGKQAVLIPFTDLKAKSRSVFYKDFPR